MKSRALALAVAVVAAGVIVAAEAQPQADLKTVHRIKDEAFRDSKVMDTLFYLTDVNGPRLSGSPGWDRAATWAMGRLKEFGVDGAHLETWGRFGRGWTLKRFSASLLEPAYAPLNGVPKAWTAGTNGPVTGDLVFAPVVADKTTGDLWDLDILAKAVSDYAEAQKGKLHGRIVLIEPPPNPPLPSKPLVERYSDAKLEELAVGPEPEPLPDLEWPLKRLPADRDERSKITDSLPMEVTSDFYLKRRRIMDRLSGFLRDEGVTAILGADKRGTGGVIFAEGVRSGDPDAPVSPAYVVLAPEAYDRLVRLVNKGAKPRVALDVAVEFRDDAPDASNVIAEIPGGAKRDQVVMLGAHLDSWHGGTGATDNAAGCAVALEAMRILKTLDLKMDRTVRLALWSGEEQGLLGSRAYVKRHFADPVTMKVLPEHAHLSGYFNLDNGTGRVRGVYLQGNDMVRPLFEAWLLPFKDLGATTLALADTGSTDHKSFDAVGLPGFQFIQDPLDYMTRTHHSDLDVYDHIVPTDLMQASAVMASFVYHAAMLPDMLPRKPLPPPLPEKMRSGGLKAGG